MQHDGTEDASLYKVVVNHEGHYSLWPIERDPPPGWKDGGKSGTRSECLIYIKEVWTDMKPLSLRMALQAEKHQ